MIKSFKHSGDMGDIIFSLPVIRAAGDGVLYLDPEGGKREPLVNWLRFDHTKLTESSIEQLRPILEEQPYIKEVKLWRGGPVGCNLDMFRQHVRFNNLSDSHLASVGLPLKERDTAWLSIPPKKIPNKSVVFCRSARYHGNYSFWEQQISDELIEKGIFIGYEKEYEYFCYTFPHLNIEYYKVENAYEIAQIISGCSLFIGNQGLPHALAEAMKKKLVNETFKPYPAAVFEREGAKYV